MKKIRVLAILICVFLLAGCKQNNENIETGNNNVVDTTIDNNVQVSEQELEEIYKLSDTYYISGEKLENMDRIIDLLGVEDIYQEEYHITSDGVDFKITCEKNEEGSERSYDVRVNGEILSFEYTSEGEAIPFGYSEECYDLMWEIDLDENDQYKEIVLKRVYGLDSHTKIYRLTNSGLELMFDTEDSWNEFIKVQGKWIFTNYFYIHEGYDFTEGYYALDDGEFKYIDRFATGEKIMDENGVFPEGFQNLEFLADGEYITIESGDMSVRGKFRFISCEEQTYSTKYNVQLIEESEYFPFGSFGIDVDIERLPAGTVLESVEIGRQY